MVGPIDDGRQAGIDGDASKRGVASADRLGQHAIRRGLQPSNGGGLIGITALDTGKVIKIPNQGRIKVIGLIGNTKDRIGQGCK